MGKYLGLLLVGLLTACYEAPTQRPVHPVDSITDNSNSEQNTPVLDLNLESDSSENTVNENNASNNGATNNSTDESSEGNTKYSVAIDNMGRAVSKSFEGLTLTVVTNKLLSHEETTSKDTIAVYGKINNHNTGALLKINSHYSRLNEIMVEVEKEGIHISKNLAILENDGSNTLYFGEITVK